MNSKKICGETSESDPDSPTPYSADSRPFLFIELAIQDTGYRRETRQGQAEPGLKPYARPRHIWLQLYQR